MPAPRPSVAAARPYGPAAVPIALVEAAAEIDDETQGEVLFAALRPFLASRPRHRREVTAPPDASDASPPERVPASATTIPPGRRGRSPAVAWRLLPDPGTPAGKALRRLPRPRRTGWDRA